MPRAQRSTWKASSPLLPTPVIPWCARPGLCDWLFSPAHGLGWSTFFWKALPLWICSGVAPYLCPSLLGTRPPHLPSILVHGVGMPPAQGPGDCSQYILPPGCIWKPGCECHEDRPHVGHAQPCPRYSAHWWGPTQIAVTPNCSPHSAFPPSVIFRVIVLKYRQHHVTLCSKLPVASDHTHSSRPPPFSGLHGPSRPL